MHSRFLLAIALMLACSVALHAENPSQLVTKTYPVADLVIPIPDRVQFGSAQPTAAAPTEPVLSEKLIQLVTETVQPSSWSAKGGRGKIEFAKAGYSLIVTNTPDALIQVSELLETLRRLQNINIVFEARVITVAAETKLSPCPAKEGEIALLTDSQLNAVVNAVQANRRASVMQAPKVTAFDGQEVGICITEKQAFVTGIEAQRVKGQAVLIPKTTFVETGITMTIRGQLSADKKFVSVNASYTNKRIDGKTEMIPVVTPVTPVLEGGVQGKPIPFTQYLQTPQIETVKIEKKGLEIPAGGHVVITGPVCHQESREEHRVPILSGISHLNRLFTNASNSKAMMRTYLVVSPRVIELTEECPQGRGK
jgi:type II secretory pathway component GspD/PulD (secretin)